MTRADSCGLAGDVGSRKKAQLSKERRQGRHAHVLCPNLAQMRCKQDAQMRMSDSRPNHPLACTHARITYTTRPIRPGAEEMSLHARCACRREPKRSRPNPPPRCKPVPGTGPELPGTAGFWHPTLAMCCQRNAEGEHTAHIDNPRRKEEMEVGLTWFCLASGRRRSQSSMSSTSCRLGMLSSCQSGVRDENIGRTWSFQPRERSGPRLDMSSGEAAAELARARSAVASMAVLVGRGDSRDVEAGFITFCRRYRERATGA